MITYDEIKCRVNIEKHGIDFATLTGFFDGDLLTREDTRDAYGEQRFQSDGWHNDGVVLVVWTQDDDEAAHIISARKAERHEREAWAKFCGRIVNDDVR